MISRIRSEIDAFARLQLSGLALLLVPRIFWCGGPENGSLSYRVNPLIRSEFEITETELRAIAPAATMGPPSGLSRPKAATGISRML